jgi:receptor protein-tyrosine kinase
MNAPAATISKMQPVPGDRSIGAILVDGGKLTVEHAEQIIGLQKQTGARFGEAALQLGLVTAEDLQFALARQYGYPTLRRGEAKVSEELVAAYQPYSHQVEALRALRSQLMLRWFTGEAGNKALAIVSPGRGEGRSYLAANLAVVFSQLGESTLLVDADMRHGRQHQLFNLENQIGLSTVLSGRVSAAPVRRLNDLVDLSVITAGPVPPNPQELLGREVFTKLLDKFASLFDVIIIDTPAGTDYADAQTIGARAGGALLVARQNHTGLHSAGAFGETLGQLGTSLVGAVLNQF